jgi:hypothetical protein
MLGELYAQSVLDCVIESAVAISADYYARPNQYGGVPEPISNVLEAFRSKTGSDPGLPNYAQRHAMYTALIGNSEDATTSFAMAAAEVRAAASDYAQAAILNGQVGGAPVLSPGEPALRRAFLDALATFHSVLSVVTDTAASRSVTQQTKGMFASSAAVLASAPVANAFGVQPAPGENWPISATQDGKGALLVQEVSQKLAGGNLRPVKMRQFLLLQRVAISGMMSIRFAFQKEPDKGAPKAIEAAYSWATALGQLERQRPGTT